MPVQYKFQIFILLLLITLNNFLIQASCICSGAGGSDSTAVGTSASAPQSGSIALGYSSSAAAANSIALGAESSVIETALGSVALGFQSNVRQYYSVAIGQESSIIGTNSVALGFQSEVTQDNSVAIGASSHAYGALSIAVGEASNAYNSNSVAIGQGSNVYGSSSTVLGGSSNKIYTGANYSTIVGGRNNIINTGVSNAYAIGNNIHLVDTGAFVWSDGTSTSPVESNGENSFTIYASGGIFFKKRATRGKKISDRAGAMALEIQADGRIIENLSSRKYKKDIEPIGENETDNLYDLEPVKFYYNNNQATGPKEFGLIAEDVEKYYKELVVYNEEDEPESVKYRVLPVLMLNELKKLKTYIKNLQINHEELKKDHDDLQTDIQNISANYQLEIQDLKNYIRTLKER